MNLKEKVISIMPRLENHWPDIAGLFKMKLIPEKTTLLEEGDISKYLFIVSKGCLRQYRLKEDGKEITIQFFFEKQMVASMESAFTEKPGNLYLESIEESEIIMIRL